MNLNVDGGGSTTTTKKDSSGNSYTSPTLMWPLAGVACSYGSLSRDAGSYDSSLDTSVHKGMDIGCGYGTTVCACAEGRVEAAYYDNSWGNVVLQVLTNGFSVCYAHLASINTNACYAGAYITKGVRIGYADSTGNSTGNHLHFEVAANSTGSHFSNRNSGGRRQGYFCFYDINWQGFISTSSNYQEYGSGNTGAGADTTTTNGQISYEQDISTGTFTGGSDSSGTGSSSTTTSKDITEVKIYGNKKPGRLAIYETDRTAVITEGVEILISNGTAIYLPMLIDSVTLERPRNGTQTLKFSVYNDGEITIEDGNQVSLKWNGEKVFYGFVFSVKATNSYTLEVTCYDQMRYLKNKGAYKFDDVTLNDVLSTLCDDNGIVYSGDNSDRCTRKISLDISEQTGLDWLSDAILETEKAWMTKKKLDKVYCVFDDFGKIVVKEMSPYVEHTLTDDKTKEKTTYYDTTFLSNVFIDNETMEEFDWEATIDDQSMMGTSNKLMLAYDDSTDGRKKIYVYNKEDSQNKFGRLVEYEKNSGFSEVDTRTAFRRIWNKKRTDASLRLQVKGVQGDIKTRGGTYVPIEVKMGMEKFNTCQFMFVEEVKHSWENGRYTMDLTLRGGEYDV